MIDSLDNLAIPCENEEDYIEHHGVLGMKWGVRRKRPYLRGYRGREVGDVAKNRREINNEWFKEYKKQRSIINDKRKKIATEANKHTNFLNNKNDKKSAKQFNKLMDEYTILTRNRNKEAIKKARDNMIKRFGEEKINDIAKKNKRNLAVAAGVTGALGVITLKRIRNYNRSMATLSFIESTML